MENIVTNEISGIIAPNLTPFRPDLSIAEDLYVDHAKWLLTQGLSAITPFGTTGEALSLGIEERVQLLTALVDGGISADKLLPGTGLTNIPDTIKLCRHAMELGCRAVMVLPPFYYKDVSDSGLFDFYSALISAYPDLRVYLYHIPPVAVVGLSLTLVEKLHKAFPEQIVGLKDSSGDWGNTKALLERLPELATFPGSEIPLLSALRLGALGCITATANINAAPIVALFRKWRANDADERQNQLTDFRNVFQGYNPIAAMKWLLADATGDQRWRIVRPPLVDLKDDEGRAIRDNLIAKFGFDLRVKYESRALKTPHNPAFAMPPSQRFASSRHRFTGPIE